MSLAMPLPHYNNILHIYLSCVFHRKASQDSWYPRSSCYGRLPAAGRETVGAGAAAERSIYRNEPVVVRGTSAGKQKKVVVGTLVIGTLFLMTKKRKNMKQPNTGDLYISILICTDNFSFSYMFFLVPQFGKSSTTLCRFIVAYINPHFCFFNPIACQSMSSFVRFLFFMTYWNRRWESMGFQLILQVINLFPWSVGVVSSGTFGFVQQ